MFSAMEQALLQSLFQRAERAGMTPWAFAVHTGNAHLMRLSCIYRAMSDHDYCMQVLSRKARFNHRP